MTRAVAVGTAGGALPAAERERFGDGGSNLARYATRFNCVEINSSFYRRHRPDTWARWGAIVPPDFRFAAKVPKTITHERRLVECDDLIEAFANDTLGLGAKFDVALVQLAPSHEFDEATARLFFPSLAARIPASLVCEPRHPSWFTADADVLLTECGVSRAAADPAISPIAAQPGGSPELGYWRLHGSPAIYRSSYDSQAVEDWAGAIAIAPHQERWCVFDNTASSAATGNALDMASSLQNTHSRPFGKSERSRVN